MIELRHRTAEDVAPLLQPLLKPGDTLVPHRTQLILKTDPVTLGEIRSVLAHIDKRQHRLRISVRQVRNLTAAAVQGGVIAEIPPGQVHGHAGLREQRERQQADQFVQTLDGQAALIETGAARLLVYGYADNVTYQQATTGFAVTPHLTGQGMVQLNLVPWSGQFQPDGRLDLQHSATHAAAPLGAWVEIGGINLKQTRQQLGQTEAQGEATRIFIRVEDLDTDGE